MKTNNIKSIQNRRKLARYFIGLLTIAIVMSLGSVVAMANIFDTAEAIGNTFISDLKSIAYVLGVVAGIICALTYLLSGDERKAATAKSWGIRIIIALACIFLIDQIIGTVRTYTAAGAAGVSSSTP